MKIQRKTFSEIVECEKLDVKSVEFAYNETRERLRHSLESYDLCQSKIKFFLGVFISAFLAIGTFMIQAHDAASGTGPLLAVILLLVAVSVLRLLYIFRAQAIAPPGGLEEVIDPEFLDVQCEREGCPDFRYIVILLDSCGSNIDSAHHNEKIATQINEALQSVLIDFIVMLSLTFSWPMIWSFLWPK